MASSRELEMGGPEVTSESLLFLQPWQSRELAGIVALLFESPRGLNATLTARTRHSR